MASIGGSQFHSFTELRYCSRGPRPVSEARGTQLDPHLNIPLLLGLVNYGWFANTLPLPPNNEFGIALSQCLVSEPKPLSFYSVHLLRPVLRIKLIRYNR